MLLISALIKQALASSDTKLSSLLARCRGPESNWGHADFQSAALPTELPGRHQSVTMLIQNGVSGVKHNLNILTKEKRKAQTVSTIFFQKVTNGRLHSCDQRHRSAHIL